MPKRKRDDDETLKLDTTNLYNKVGRTYKGDPMRSFRRNETSIDPEHPPQPGWGNTPTIWRNTPTDYTFIGELMISDDKNYQQIAIDEIHEAKKKEINRQIMNQAYYMSKVFPQIPPEIVMEIASHKITKPKPDQYNTYNGFFRKFYKYTKDKTEDLNYPA